MIIYQYKWSLSNEKNIMKKIKMILQLSFIKQTIREHRDIEDLRTTITNEWSIQHNNWDINHYIWYLSNNLLIASEWTNSINIIEHSKHEGSEAKKPNKEHCWWCTTQAKSTGSTYRQGQGNNNVFSPN